MARETLQTALEARAAPMALARDEGKGRLRCLACGHRCLIPEGRAGICKVRFNRGGTLYGPWGYVAALQDDPIEKKPFYHALPGSMATSFGMLGCDFHCGYCQNWLTSQALRDEQALAPIRPIEARAIVDHARHVGALSVTSTYNEPLITSEWAVEVFREARAARLTTAYVSNGNSTDEVIAYLRPWLDLCKIDLKGFDDKRYRALGGTLQNVLDGIARAQRAGFWVEVVTLVVPGFNDSDEELRAIAGFLVELSPDIPWHVTAFHPDYRMSDRGATPVATLMRARTFGQAAGLRYVYAGNLPGRVGDGENTRCPQCGELLIERRGFRVLRQRLERGQCARCRAPIPGFWEPRAAEAPARVRETRIGSP
ncbi:MAG: AmmeMemoRadiSam system radical SAM enzyme [Candidatus Lambdaproteobacteria bacterium]|nr:AmmeMemoRadiSam system radical SAM enzyme [Candidatus Lambdaproteobacteria bacterium]